MASTELNIGYTKLHIAVFRNDKNLVEKLIRNGADVNSVGEDGVQPIHLACLYHNFDIAVFLLKAGADFNCQFSKELVEKYDTNNKWIDDFGGKMTLVTFAVINSDSDSELFEHLFFYKTIDFGMKSSNNKTLLMYAIEHDNYNIARTLLLKSKKPIEWINARDDNGWHAVHYFLPAKKFNYLRFNGEQMVSEIKCSLQLLISYGANINATVDNNPDTLLINMAAYRRCKTTLEQVMKINVPLSEKSKVLYYATLPIEGRNNVYGIRMRQEIIKYILQDYTFRRSFGLFVPKDEIELMDQLIQQNRVFDILVKDYKSVIFSEDLAVNYRVRCGGQFLSTFEATKIVFDTKTLKQRLNDITVVPFWASGESFSKFRCEDGRIYELCGVIDKKVNEAKRRRFLEKRMSEIGNLREAVPLPYELVLIIIEYIDNESLLMFIYAFYQDYSGRFQYLYCN